MANRPIISCKHLYNQMNPQQTTQLPTVTHTTNRITAILIGINIAMFILAIIVDFRHTDFNPSPFQFLSPSMVSLYNLGATGTIPLLEDQRWWTLIAAGFLHGGLLHLVFNMIAVHQLAPLVIVLFGVNRAIILYTLGSVGGYLLSCVGEIQYTIGASAALCSLIGALLYYGKSRGDNLGRAIFNHIGGWVISIAVVGFLIPGINNWGHGGGLLSGLLLGYIFGSNDSGRETSGHRVGAAICVIGSCLALLWSCFNGAVLLFVLK